MTRANYENRPRIPPPCDRLHEFLVRAMSTDDPEYLTWLTHLKQSKAPHSMCRESDGRMMLYCHRIVTDEIDAYWCCDPERPKVRIGKKKRRV